MLYCNFRLQADVETLKARCQRFQTEKEKADKQQVRAIILIISLEKFKLNHLSLRVMVASDVWYGSVLLYHKNTERN